MRIFSPQIIHEFLQILQKSKKNLQMHFILMAVYSNFKYLSILNQQKRTL